MVLIHGTTNSVWIFATETNQIVRSRYTSTTLELAIMQTEQIISPQHYEGIGKVIVAWARLEAHMLQSIRAILGLSATQVFVIFWQMGYRDRSQKLRMIAKTKLSSIDKKEFEALLKEMDKAYGIRNIVAHFVWHSGSIANAITPLDIKIGNGKIRTTKDRHKTPRERDFTSVRFQEEAAKISDLADRFKTFSIHHFGAEFLHDTEGEGRH
jgi:hypothetical protein